MAYYCLSVWDVPMHRRAWTWWMSPPSSSSQTTRSNSGPSTRTHSNHADERMRMILSYVVGSRHRDREGQSHWADELKQKQDRVLCGGAAQDRSRWSTLARFASRRSYVRALGMVAKNGATKCFSLFFVEVTSISSSLWLLDQRRVSQQSGTLGRCAPASHKVICKSPLLLFSNTY